MPNQMIALQARGPQLPDLSRQTAQYANMMNMARQQEAAQRQAQQAQQAMDIGKAQEARAVELHTPALAEAGAKATAADIKTAMDFNKYVRTALSNADSPQQVTAFAQRIASQPQFKGEIFQGALSDAIASMPTDPAQFGQWKETTYLGTLEADKRYEQEYIKQTTGTEERIVGLSKYGRGKATEVPGSRIQVAPGMTYVRGADGAVYPMPSKSGGGFATPAPSMGAPGGGDTFKIMIGLESRGNQFTKSGTPLTSPKGAIGIAQIMPGTAPEAAKLAGLPYDKTRLSNDRDYNYALGEAYFNKQLADFGDPRLAAAAYNAGPGAVRSALKKGGPDGWINFVPRETQNYVASIPGGGGAAAPASGGGRGTAGAPVAIIPGAPPKPAKPPAPAITPEKQKARAAAAQALYDAVQDAQKKGHLVSEKQSYVANRATELRQGRTYAPGGTAQKSSQDLIKTAAAQLLRQFVEKGTTGTMNAVAEQELFLKGVGGGDSTYETRLQTIRNFAKQNGIKLNEGGAAKPKAQTATKTPTKSNIPEDIAKMYGL